MSHKMKVLLTVSLALNILLAGIFIGQFSKDFMKYREWEKDIEKSVGKLPPDKAKLVKEALWTLKNETRETKKEIRKTRGNISKILVAPEFNEADFDKEIKKLHELQGRIMSYFAEATKELASQFNRDERRIISDLLQNRRRGYRHSVHNDLKLPPKLDQQPPF